MNLFVAGGSEMLTDHVAHGEGLIVWNILERLAARGHSIVACASAVDLTDPVAFEVVEISPRTRFESLRGIAYSLAARRVLRARPERFDAVVWIMPQGRDHLLWRPTSQALIIGPLALEWPTRRRRRAGDVVRALLAPLTERAHRQTLRRARAIIVSLDEVATSLPRGLSAPPVVIPFGVDPTRFTAAPLPGVPTIAFVGSLEQKKGVRDLVDAFRIVRSTVPDARLVIAGDGPERAWLDACAAEDGFGGAIQLLGRIEHGDVPTLLSSASVVCLPSLGEPFGLAVLEAMASGRAVVAADVGGPRVLLDGDAGGRLVPPGDVGAIARALVDLLGDETALAEIGRRNRVRVETTFAWDVVVDRIEAIIEHAATTEPIGAGS